MKTKREILEAQRAYNRFRKKHPGLDLPTLIEDGVKGHASRKAFHQAYRLLGYGSKKCKKAYITEEFVHRLKHPNHIRSNAKFKDWDRKKVRRGKKRRARRHAAVLKNTIKAVFSSGTTFYDGRPIAKWIVPYCEWARRTVVNGRRWVGRVVSGWRDPAYSVQLCYGICGRPSCPGLCAGASSGHSQKDRPRGCIDVSDYEHFRAAMRACPLSPKLINDLPIDRVHFSVTGH